MNYKLGEHGFCLVEKLLSDSTLRNFVPLDMTKEFSYINMSPPKFSNIDCPDDKIVQKIKDITGSNYKCFMKKQYHKTAFIGSHEGYHQDFFYRQNLGISSHKFLQCFIALDDLDYCPLNVFIGSHKKGLLEHETLIERDGKAKYIIPQQVLRQFKNDFLSIKLKRGDALFFNYLLVHGSASNASPFNQRRAILQYCTEEVKPISHGDDRRDTEIKILKQFLDEKL